MLRRLTIRDFVIVDRLELEFEAGFGALTGGTGAGKAILVDALALAMGDRAGAGVVRNGCKQAEVSAEFELAGTSPALDWLTANDLAADDACLMRRVIEAGRRSRGYINGSPATAAQLRELGDLGLPLARLAIRMRLLRAGLLTQPYVLIGHPDDVEEAATALASEPLLGYHPVAVDCPHPGERLVAFKNGQVVAPTALTPAVREFLARPGDYQLVGVLGIRDNNWLRELSLELMHTRDDLVMVPALGDLPMYGMEVSHLFSHDVLFLRARNNLHRRGPQFLKRTMDIVGSASLLLALSPLFAYFAWKISRDGGSPFFGHVRVGQHGKPFKCYKFRSMVVNAQEELKKLLANNPAARAEWERDFKLRNDPRISKIGAFLRRTSLDELPQLWNVLVGEMRLVGPRPLIHDELARYGKDVVYYLTSRPGMTGLWQVSGRSDTSYGSRIRFDAWYVRNWSLWYDLVIMLRTVRVVLKQEGAV